MLQKIYLELFYEPFGFRRYSGCVLVVEHLAYMVARLQGKRYKLRGHGDPAVTHFVERSLSLVREAGYRVKPEHSCRAFYGVHAPEYGGDSVHIVWILLQLKKIFLKFVKKIVGFAKKNFCYFIKAFTHDASPIFSSNAFTIDASSMFWSGMMPHI